MPTSIIVHERIADWSTRLRPRFGDDSALKWVESRSVGDLVPAVEGRGRSIVLINLHRRPYWGLEGLDALESIAHNSLILVIDPDRVPEVPMLARELGATLVLSGVVVAPPVEKILRRWLGLLGAPLKPAQPSPLMPKRR